MRNGFATSFWHSAYQSLPAQVRARYAADLQAAERWELGLEALIEAWSRTKILFSRAAPAH
jgi:hypothetical protein